jgi:DNA-binding transcriptional MerR regulator
VGERSYLSIGDVLSLLREEFPDITISKIRFLESRGLLIPERTPSGYRKFYEHDVDRLRWILRQQRENFLPLKVIKGRLEGQEPSSGPTPMFDVAPRADAPPPVEPVYVSHQANGAHDPLERLTAEVGAGAGRHMTVAVGAPRVSAGTGAITPRPAAGERLEETTTLSASEPAGEEPDSHARAADRPARDAKLGRLEPAMQAREPGMSAGEPEAGTREHSSGGSGRSSAATPTGSGAESDLPTPTATGGPRPSKAAASASSAGEVPASAAERPSEVGSAPPAHAGGLGPSGEAVVATSGGGFSRGSASNPDSGSLSGASLTVAELAQASGLRTAQVEELESYGLIESRLVAGVRCYDEDALVVSGLAAGFARFGIEARHLRLFKHAAERQASLYSQVVMPLLRQRNPTARRRAHDDLMKLADLGASMQACFAKAVLRDLTRQ